MQLLYNINTEYVQCIRMSNSNPIKLDYSPAYLAS